MILFLLPCANIGGEIIERHTFARFRVSEIILNTSNEKSYSIELLKKNKIKYVFPKIYWSYPTRENNSLTVNT